MKTIAVVEDDTAVAESLAALVAGWGYVCRTYSTGEAFLEAIGAGSDPAGAAVCVLLDVKLPGIDGLSLLDSFRAHDPTTPVIVMTGHGDVRMAVDAMRRGAQDFIEKPFDGDDLMERIGTVIEQAIPDLVCRRKLARLTARETEVLREIFAGHQNKVIAYRLGISQKTVELHRARVMRKTGAKSVSQLIRIALRGGIEAGDPA